MAFFVSLNGEANQIILFPNNTDCMRKESLAIGPIVFPALALSILGVIIACIATKKEVANEGLLNEESGPPHPSWDQGRKR